MAVDVDSGDPRSTASEIVTGMIWASALGRDCGGMGHNELTFVLVERKTDFQGLSR